MEDISFALAIGYIVLTIVLLAAIAINLATIRKIAEKMLFPEGLPLVIRLCPHCRRQIPALASVCFLCGRESEPWVLEGDRWSMSTSEGTRLYLDPRTRTWVEPAEGTEA